MNFWTIAIFLILIIGFVFGYSYGYSQKIFETTIYQDNISYYQGFGEGYKTAETEISLKYRWNATSYQDGYDVGYEKGFDDFCCKSNILFAGSTFTYDNKYVVKARDITPKKVEIIILQDGNEIDRGFCYSNKFCNINNVSFQIDDIHIGKEASYLVYWSDK